MDPAVQAEPACIMLETLGDSGRNVKYGSVGAGGG